MANAHDVVRLLLENEEMDINDFMREQGTQTKRAEVGAWYTLGRFTNFYVLYRMPYIGSIILIGGIMFRPGSGDMVFNQMYETYFLDNYKPMPGAPAMTPESKAEFDKLARKHAPQ
jgi:hypothetical protein